MSNVYTAGTVDGVFVILDESTIILHGATATGKALELAKAKVSPTVIAQHFCGCCGNYTETPGVCGCGDYREQYL